MTEAGHTLLTPIPAAGRAGSGAIAVVCVEGSENEIDALFPSPVSPGEVCLRSLLGVDHGIVVRWSSTVMHLMPHGGQYVVRRLGAALDEAGFPVRPSDPRSTFPEARSAPEAIALDVLSRSYSPMAIPLLLEQVRRWEAGVDHRMDADAEQTLQRVLIPPVVAAVGAPNIGKSSLLNRLAGRRVALEADVPGTTRDHIGVALVVDGLAVQWIDLPGWDGGIGALEADAWDLARPSVLRADLVLLCSDEQHPAPDLREMGLGEGLPLLRCGLRCDRGGVDGVDVETSVRTGVGLPELAREVRQRLVPDACLDLPGRWLFEPRLEQD